MKKLFVALCTAATLFVAAPAQAQFSFGLKGGLNVTSMSLSKDVVDPSNQAGFFVGPTVKFTLPLVGLGVDAAALYDQRSSEVYDQTLKQQSIQVPINVRYGVGLGSLASVFVFAGPQFGFNVGDKVTSVFNDAADWTLRSSNLSANVGLGVSLLKHLQVSANYNIALGTTGEITPLDGAKTAFNTALGKAKSNSWQIALAYYF